MHKKLSKKEKEEKLLHLNIVKVALLHEASSPRYIFVDNYEREQSD